MVDLDGDGVDELLVPRNVPPTASLLNIANFTGVTGEILVVSREGDGFGLRSLTTKLPGLVSGIGLARKSPLALFVAVAKTNFPPFSGGKSQFLLSETAEPGR